jgi:hypothetical protein
MDINIRPRLFEQLTKYLQRNTGLEYKIVFITVCLWTLSYWTLIIYEIGFQAGQEDIARKHPETVYIGDGSYFLLYWTMQNRILICLLGILIGLWIRRAIGYVFSLLCNLAIAGIFCHWYLQTLRFISNLELDKGEIQHRKLLQEVGLFYGGTFLDYITFGFTIILIIWHSIQFVKAYQLAKLIVDKSK